MAGKKKITKEEVSEILREDRATIKEHLAKFQNMSEKTATLGDAEERAFFVYHGSRSTKLLELLLKNNEAMIRFLANETDDAVIVGDDWKNEQAEPAPIEKSVFGD